MQYNVAKFAFNHRNKPMNQSIEKAVAFLKQGDVIAYPTEAVFGLGCDPFNEAAVRKLFHVKQRPFEKGVILIAASIEQVEPYVELTGTSWFSSVNQSWPGPKTWVLPTKKPMPDWITGGRDTVAVRVTDHPLVQALCKAYGGMIVSTSANLSGSEPALSCEEVEGYFANQVFCLQGELGGLQKPTEIWDAVSNRQLR